MKKHLPIILMLAISCSLQSCFVFGIHTHINWTARNGYEHKYRRYKIKHEQELYLDTSFATHMRELYAKDKKTNHDRQQPVQYLLFDKQGRLLSLMINCDAHVNSLMYANWNYKHRFDTFPTQTMCPTDTILKLADVLQTVRDTTGGFLKPVANEYDYTEIVLFNSVLYRASKELIRTVKHQDKKGAHVRTLYINSDNNLLWSYADSATRKKIIANYTDL